MTPSRHGDGTGLFRCFLVIWLHRCDGALLHGISARQARRRAERKARKSGSVIDKDVKNEIEHQTKKLLSVRFFDCLPM